MPLTGSPCARPPHPMVRSRVILTVLCGMCDRLAPASMSPVNSGDGERGSSCVAHGGFSAMRSRRPLLRRRVSFLFFLSPHGGFPSMRIRCLSRTAWWLFLHADPLFFLYRMVAFPPCGSLIFLTPRGGFPAMRFHCSLGFAAFTSFLPRSFPSSGGLRLTLHASQGLVRCGGWAVLRGMCEGCGLWGRCVSFLFYLAPHGGFPSMRIHCLFHTA